MSDRTFFELTLNKGGTPVQAEVLEGILDAPDLQDWLIHWRGEMAAICQELRDRGVPTDKWPESSTWNWQNKVTRTRDTLANRGFALRAEEMTQGLILADLCSMHRCRIPAQTDKDLVYVDYLESAPWNIGYVRPKRYSGVGFALLATAVHLSFDEGFKGRVGLHSLPGARDFYRHYELTDFGPDSEDGGLHYFELSEAHALKLLQK